MQEAYLCSLACVARADGIIAPQKLDAIRFALDRSGVDASVADAVNRILDVSKRVDADAILGETIKAIQGFDGSAGGAGLLAETVRDCYVMAAIDGRISPEEVAVIERLLELAGIPARRRPTLHQWAESAARHALDGAALFAESLKPRD